MSRKLFQERLRLIILILKNSVRMTISKIFVGNKLCSSKCHVTVSLSIESEKVCSTAFNEDQNKSDWTIIPYNECPQFVNKMHFDRGNVCYFSTMI